MKMIKQYCGKAIVQQGVEYFYVDIYSGKVIIRSLLLEECEMYLNAYISELANRD